MEQTKSKRVLNLITEFLSKKETVNRDSRLYHDLNLYGDDADELLERYSLEFGVEIPTFKFTDYFPEEGDMITSTLLRIITLRPKPVYKELKVDKLIQGAEKGILYL